MEQNKMKIAYVITQRKDRNFWNRVGVAFVNSDGSINVKLEAVPVSGEIQIRDYQPRDELAASSRNHSRDLVEEEPTRSSPRCHPRLRPREKWARTLALSPSGI